MITLNNVTIGYGNRIIFSRFSQDFSSGKVHILLGSSGCGKTTLLRAMSGLLEVSANSIQLQGRDVSTIQGKEKMKYFGLMFQEGCLLPHLTAKENILMPANLISSRPADLDQRLQQLCEMAHFEGRHLHKYPKQLSGGQKQRVSLMRILLIDAPIIFMDEPLSALDPLVRQSLLVDLRKIFKKLQKTIIFVTHNLREAAYLGDRLYLIHHGKIVQQGAFTEIYNNPKTDFVKEFITSQVPSHD